MSLATPTPAAAEHAAVPGPEPSTSQLLKMLVSTLNRLVHPSIGPGILRAAAADAGIDVKDLLPLVAVRGRPKGKVASDKPAKGGSRGMMPYTLFVSKVMDRLKEDPEYLNRLPDSNGKILRPMSVAGIIWKQLGEETRETFIKSYQPLCDALKSERVESGGLKTEGLLAKIHAFEATFDPTVKNQLKDILPAHLSSILNSGAVPALPEGAVHEEDEDEESEESEEEEEDPAAAAAAKRLEEEKRLEAEKKAKEEAEKKKKEERAAKKKEKQQLAAAAPQLAAAAPKAPGAAPVAPAAGAEDKKAKKKHKAKEQGDQPGSSKKIKKDKV